MRVKDSVLKFLEDNTGSAVSGEHIAAELGVSRNSVWKAIKALKDDGYSIEAGTNKGYTLVSNNDIISAQSISKYLRNSGLELHVFPSVGSTNDVLKKFGSEGAPEGTVAISEEQTAGKGRLGRKFESPGRVGIYMSILLRPRFSAEESLSITTAAAVAVAGAIDEVTGERAKIKWVNDVYLHGYKVCGILTEASMSFESGGLDWVVLGIGINVIPPEGGFPENIRDVAGALFKEKCPADTRSRLAAAVLDHFMGFYAALPEKTYMEEYKSRSLLDGVEISYSSGSRSERGTVIGIDDNAKLVVRLENGEEQAYSTGEVNINKDFLKKIRS